MLVYVARRYEKLLGGGYFWPPIVMGRPLYFCPVVSSIFFIFYFFSSPNLSRRRLYVYHTSTHCVALVRI